MFSSASLIQKEEDIFCTKHVLRAFIKVRIICPRIYNQPVTELRFQISVELILSAHYVPSIFRENAI